MLGPSQKIFTSFPGAGYSGITSGKAHHNIQLDACAVLGCAYHNGGLIDNFNVLTT